MKTDKTGRKVRQAFHRITPELSPSLMEECRNAAPGDLPAKPRRVRWISGLAAACMAVLITGAGIFGYRAAALPAATVSLDVNPGISLELNRQNRVLQAAAVNSDGAQLMGQKDYAGASLEEAVRDLVDSMVSEGYLSPGSNSILVSVSGKNASDLEARLCSAISGHLDSRGIDGAVLSQVVDLEEADDLAASQGISPGKAQLALCYAAENPRYTPEELTKLNIHQLNVLMQSSQLNLQPLHSTGTASRSAYITPEEALAAALAHTGAQEYQMLEIDLESEDGLMVYEVEFLSGSRELEVEVNAETGEVLSSEADDDLPPVPQADFIGQEAAAAAALSHVGADPEQVTGLFCQLDEEDGVILYEVEFTFQQRRYEISVASLTGEILENEISLADDDDNPELSEPPALSREEAQAAALRYAGAAAEDVTGLTCRLDTENGLLVYEVEFLLGDTEYECEVSAETGELVSLETEQKD